MGFSCGIVGLPNVGKSTLFNCLSSARADAANYPFCTIEPNVGIVEVPDARLTALAGVVHPQRILPTTTRFVDIAGIVRGASKGEGLGNKFLAHIRDVDAICHVVRCFTDANVVHVDGAVNPVRDVGTIETELVLADLESVEKRLDRAVKMSKGTDPVEKKAAAFCAELRAHLDQGKPARSFPTPDDEDMKAVLAEMHLLTVKPTLFVANVDESGFDAATNPHLKALKELAASRGDEVLPLCAKIESEVAELPPAERADFLASLGMTSSGLDRLIQAGYRILGLASYLTAGEKEVRAWTITKGMKAPQAAGVIHSDFERGFIKAEVIWWEDFVALGGEARCREAGKLRLEGKDYLVRDGDVMHFKFNV
ncbi:MAG: redox-regulated ATPase YchF [Deltaproteobacteria bacterium]|nr:redox-regulated ATPase YchF [Deltaproteobacteria bacterium]